MTTLDGPKWWNCAAPKKQAASLWAVTSTHGGFPTQNHLQPWQSDFASLLDAQEPHWPEHHVWRLIENEAWHHWLMCMFAKHSKGKHGVLFHHHYLASENAKHVMLFQSETCSLFQWVSQSMYITKKKMKSKVLKQQLQNQNHHPHLHTIRTSWWL